MEEEYGPGLVEHYNRLRLYDLLQHLLLEERLKVVGSDEQRQHDLRKAIEEREAQLADDSTLDILFEDYIVNLPTNQHPQSKPQQHRMFTEWEGSLQTELDNWKDELVRLEDQPIDKRLIFDRAKDRIMYLLYRAAQDIDLLPDANDFAIGVNRDTPQSKSGSKTAQRAPQKRSSGRRKGAGKTRKEASEVAKRIKSAGGSYADIEKELAERGFTNTKGKPYSGVSTIYNLLNL